uniref:Uncharacterized protein n=1 Tax=Arundo donax TaxID=35708 RepID=A0A0A8YD31_ARUDO
MDRASEGE